MNLRAAAARLLASALHPATEPERRTETLPGIRLHEASIRALLVRASPLACSRAGEGLVEPPAVEALETLEPALSKPIRSDLPGRAAGAPRRDARALRRLRARWIELRAKRAERLMDETWGSFAA